MPIVGDLVKPLLGLSKADVKKLTGKIEHFFHLAAVYDLKADAESQVAINVDGTKNAVELANEIDAGIFQHVSSIAAAGMYEGVFREDMFDEAEGLDHPYFATKHESEKIARTEARMPWRVYRPGLVVGDSKTGEMDKIDGPVLLLQADPEDAGVAAAMDADGGPGGRPDQHRAGGFRGRCDRSHCAQERARRQGIPSGRSDAVPRRRRTEHLRPCCARARSFHCASMRP